MSTEPQPATITSLLDSVYPGFALLAGMQLDVFTALQHGPLTADELARSLGVHAAKLRQLLYALAGAGLLQVAGDRFSNTEESDRFLVRGRPSYMGGGGDLLAELWTAALQTATSIRTGEPQNRHDFATLPRHELEAYFRGLHDGALAAGRAFARAHPLPAGHSVVDIAGGSGGFAIALAQEIPGLRVTVVDLPNVIAVTEQFIAEAGIQDRVTTQTADVVREPLSGAFDVAVAKLFLQTLGPDDARRALAHISAGLAPGGTMYISGSGILEDSRLSPAIAVQFNIVLLNYYEQGQAYTISEHREWLHAAGLVDFERSTLGDVPLLIARKPL